MESPFTREKASLWALKTTRWENTMTKWLGGHSGKVALAKGLSYQSPVGTKVVIECPGFAATFQQVGGQRG